METGERLNLFGSLIVRAITPFGVDLRLQR